MGRLALRAGVESPDLAFVHVNEIAGDAATAAHLLTFDSIHGRFGRDVTGAGETLTIDQTPLTYSSVAEPGGVPWDEHGVEIVLDAPAASVRASNSMVTSRAAYARSSSPRPSKKVR